MIWAALLAVGAALADARVGDDAFDAPLRLLYDGSSETALARLAALAEAHPRDPLPLYFQALALAWKLEETPERRDLDPELLRLASLAIERADAQLRGGPDDARARFARGAAHGVKGRLHLFRRDQGASAREAVAMRSDLRRALELDAANEDARFGLALYDYYADVLPRMLKLVRFLLGIPGGDRKRGLDGLRRAALRARWHRSEALSQLYEVAAFYEHDADGALAAIRELRRSYPNSPLWGLRLGEHLRDRMGLFAESASVYAEVADASASGHPNHAPIAGGLAALGAAEAQRRDLRLDAARAGLEAVPEDRFPQLAVARARLLARIEAARADPVAAARGRARRLLEAGDSAAAAVAWRGVLAVRPRDLEAALHVAQDDLAAGRLEPAAAALGRVVRAEMPDPAWLGAAARLLLARVREAQGRHGDSVDLYNKVLTAPFGSEARRNEAAQAVRRLSAPIPGSESAPSGSKHSR